VSTQQPAWVVRSIETGTPADRARALEMLRRMQFEKRPPESFLRLVDAATGATLYENIGELEQLFYCETIRQVLGEAL
jgi:hypothetical protein